MIRHRQQSHVPGLTPGNCIQCCLAGILDEPLLDRIPHVAWLHADFTDDPAVTGNPHAWWGILRNTVADYGCGLHCISSDNREEPLPADTFPLSKHVADGSVLVGAIGCGPSPRGPWGHAVIVDEHGHLLHDPNRSDVGVPFLDEVWLIVGEAQEVAA